MKLTIATTTPSPNARGSDDGVVGIVSLGFIFLFSLYYCLVLQEHE